MSTVSQPIQFGHVAPYTADLDAIRWAYADSETEKTRRLVYLTMLVFCNEHGDCEATYEELALLTKLEQNTLRAIVRRMTADGALVRVRVGTKLVASIWHIAGFAERKGA